jgi:predicted  nucleic acid-binding Zn-ribbon protein
VAAAPALSAAAAGEIGVLAGGALTGKAATAAAEAEATAAAEAALLKTEVSGVGVAMEGAAAKSKVAGDEMVVGATRGAGAWSALKGILGKGLTAAIAIDVGFDIVNQITGVDEDARKAMTHFAASLGKGNDDVIRAFSEGNVEVERETMKWGHLITVFTDNAFKLGGVGPERNVSDIKAAFDAVLNQQGPEAAQKLVDAVKAQSSALSENDTNRVQSISLAKQWQRAIDDATAAQKANTGAVDDGAKAYGRFNQELDPDKTRIANYVSGLSEVSSMVGSVMDAEGNLSDARRRYADAQTALAGGGDGSDAERALEAADASSAAAAASRAEASARLQLEAANRRVAAAQALVDHAPTEAARAAAVDQLSAAENDRANALDRVADAQDQATASSRALHQAQADEYSTASRLADANDRLAAAKRGVQAANRELLNAERDLALAEAELAHIDPRRDPNRFREKSAQVADLRDARANAVDRVADAQDSVSSAQRGIVQAHLDAAVAKDEERQKTEDLAKAGDDLVTALIAEQQKLGELYDYIQSHPDAIPQLEQQIRDWAEAGLISVSVADAWIGRLESLRQKATETGDALERVLIGQENLTAAGVGFIQGNGGNIAQSGIGGRPGYGGIPADVWDGGRKPNSVPKSGKGGTLGQGAYAASLPVDRNGNPIFNPSRGETGTMGGRTYVWTGASWEPKAGGRATGGAVQAGRFYEVGERGFELFDMGSGRVGMIPGRDGTVQPHEAAVAALQGGTSNGRLLSSLPPASAPSGGDGMTREQAAELIALLKAGASRPIDVALDMRGQAVVPSASEVTRGVRAALWQSGVG